MNDWRAHNQSSAAVAGIGADVLRQYWSLLAIKAGSSCWGHKACKVGYHRNSNLIVVLLLVACALIFLIVIIRLLDLEC